LIFEQNVQLVVETEKQKYEKNATTEYIIDTMVNVLLNVQEQQQYVEITKENEMKNVTMDNIIEQQKVQINVAKNVQKSFLPLLNAETE
jgi:type I restriction-modification system DNA methylase subunit